MNQILLPSIIAYTCPLESSDIHPIYMTLQVHTIWHGQVIRVLPRIHLGERKSFSVTLQDICTAFQYAQEHRVHDNKMTTKHSRLGLSCRYKSRILSCRSLYECPGNIYLNFQNKPHSHGLMNGDTDRERSSSYFVTNELIARANLNALGHRGVRILV